jgi:uncharacterized cupredoxin-like copper-binding protein
MHHSFSAPVGKRLAALAALSLLVAACASPGGSTPASDSDDGTTVDVTLSEFKVELSTTSVPAGEVTFNVKNDGTVVHEFVVFKTDLAASALPEASEEPEVDEDDPSLESMGEVEDVDPGATKSFTATLTSGSYVAICNVTGHYDSGMSVAFSVP